MPTRAASSSPGSSTSTRSSGDIHAEDGVRHVLQGGVGPLGDREHAQPAVANCETFDYTAENGTIRYEGNAVLRSGDDELRARTISHRARARGSTQQLTAVGDVVARLRAGVGETATDGEATTARAGRLEYSGSRGEFRYTGGVTITKETSRPRARRRPFASKGSPGSCASSSSASRSRCAAAIASPRVAGGVTHPKTRRW